jgi:hypothetical protein
MLLIIIAGALYYISTWYKKDETSLRITFFFFGQIFAGATTSLISAGLLKLSGRGGLAGWQWIFLGTFAPLTPKIGLSETNSVI